MGIDLLSNTTGQEMATALKLIAASQSVQAREALGSVTWSELARFANDGLIKSVMDYGDQVTDTWTDNAGETPVEYSNPFHLAHIEDVELENGEILKNRPFFQTHYAQAYPVQFSNCRAFYACPDGLSAGTYYIEFAQAWSKLTTLQWTFTLTKDVPAGGRLMGFVAAADNTRTSDTVYVYGADGKTLLETVTATPGSDGTKLGTLAYTARGTGDNANCNCMQEAFYGSNRWKTSAARQYLNSAAGKGLWWTPQDEWDIAPEQLATIPGWLNGCSEDFINSLKKIKVVTYTNTVTFDGSADITYDRVTLPSLQQRYVTPQITGEGDAFEYWKRRLGRTTPQEIGTSGALDAAKTYNIKNHSEAVYERFRSATRGSASNVWSAYSAGYVSNYSARYALRFAPFVVI